MSLAFIVRNLNRSRFKLLQETIQRLEEHVEQSGMELTGTTYVDVSEMQRIAKQVRTTRMFYRSVDGIQITSGLDQNERLFKISYFREFLNEITAVPETNESLRAESLLFDRLQRIEHGVKVSIEEQRVLEEILEEV